MLKRGHKSNSPCGSLLTELFWCRTKQWLESKTRRKVETKVYAHAGAVIERSSLKYGEESFESCPVVWSSR